MSTCVSSVWTTGIPRAAARILSAMPPSHRLHALKYQAASTLCGPRAIPLLTLQASAYGRWIFALHYAYTLVNTSDNQYSQPA